MIVTGESGRSGKGFLFSKRCNKKVEADVHILQHAPKVSEQHETFYCAPRKKTSILTGQLYLRTCGEDSYAKIKDVLNLQSYRLLQFFVRKGSSM